MLTFIRLKGPKVNVIVNMRIIQEKKTKHAFKLQLALEKQQNMQDALGCASCYLV